MTATDRDEAIKTIRKALKDRSGKTWSVRGGTGTAWGWITITAPPARRDGNDLVTDAERAELVDLLALPLHEVSYGGVDIPAGDDYRQEYIDRSEGRAPSVAGKPYWD